MYNNNNINESVQMHVIDSTGDWLIESVNFLKIR